MSYRYVTDYNHIDADYVGASPPLPEATGNHHRGHGNKRNRPSRPPRDYPKEKLAPWLQRSDDDEADNQKPGIFKLGGLK